MPGIAHLPALNAALNLTAAVLLGTGWVLIKQRRPGPHQACMTSAFGVSTLFLISYLFYHSQVGSVPYAGSGWLRPLYFAVLISHTILAAAVPPLAIVTMLRARRGDLERHRRIARWTLPIWLYVSVTGVVVYAMLYHAPRD